MKAYPICPIEFEETWKFIDDSIVKNILPYYWISNKGRIYSTCTNKFLNLIIDKNGYVVVCLHLYNDYRRQVTVFVHRLVLKAFNPIENSDEFQVNHKNSIRSDNRLENLEWCTCQENIIHRSIYGQTPDISGEKNPYAKLNNDQIINIISLINSNLYSFADIAKMFQVSNSVIENIAHEKSWITITSNIDINCPVSSGFTNNEIEKICKFFEDNDINNKSLYPTNMSLFEDCFRETELDKKYSIEEKRKTLERILYKSRNSLNKIADKYNYYFNR